jgi:hypothetical protein
MICPVPLHGDDKNFPAGIAAQEIVRGAVKSREFHG